MYADRKVFCINISRLKSDYQVYHITGIWCCLSQEIKFNMMPCVMPLITKDAISFGLSDA